MYFYHRLTTRSLDNIYRVLLDLKVIFLMLHFYQRLLFFSTNSGKEKNCRLASTSRAFFQPGVKNELFNSKQAFSWPFVCFDLGTRSLHECLYCHVVFSQRVNY